MRVESVESSVVRRNEKGGYLGTKYIRFYQYGHVATKDS